MKLALKHPQGENSAFTLLLEYHVPVGDAYCLSVFSDWKKALSLHTLFEFDGAIFSMPSTLTLESGDKILLFNKRGIIVKEPLILSVVLDYHEHLIFEVVSYFIAGTYLNYQSKDPDFFTAFDRVFTIHEATPFTQQELEQNVLAEETFGDKIEDYFTIAPEIRQTFINTANAHKT